MGDTAHSKGGEHHGMGHVMPIPMLLGVFAALIFFTGLTLLLNGMVPAVLELPVAMLIATVKAALVLLFFMHVRYDKAFNAFVFLSSAVFFALFVGAALVDTSENQDAKAEYELLNPRAATEPAPAPPAKG